MIRQDPTASQDGLVDQIFAHPPIRHVLANGMIVAGQHMPGTPVASVQVWVRSGSIHESPHLGSGLSHFLEHMVFKGTARRGPGVIPEEVQGLGGIMNAYTAFDRTVYHIDLPTAAVAAALDILSDMLGAPSLADKEATREIDVILREIDMALDDPDRELSRSVLSTAFRVHPFRYPVIGHAEIFRSLTSDDLRDYFIRRYAPENMVLAIAGDFGEEALLDEIGKTFGSLPRRRLEPGIVPDEPRQLAIRECRREGPFQICRGSMAYKVPSLRDADAPALDLLAAILGSGQSSVLREELRNRQGIVSHVDASVWNPRDEGLFWIQYTCDPGNHPVVESAIREVIGKISSGGIRPEDVNRAKSFALVSEVQTRQTAKGMAARLGLAEAIVGDLHYPKQYLHALDRIDTDQLVQLAERYLVDEHLCAVTIEAESAGTLKKTRTAASNGLESFTDLVMPNGARLLLQPDKRLPRVQFRYAGLGGPQFEDPLEKGVTQLMGTLLIRDSQYRTASEIMDTLERNGGYINEMAGNNTFSVGLEVFSNRVDDALQILEEAILFPAFHQDTLERERKIQLAQVEEELDEIVDYGRRSLRQNFFGLHPFSGDPSGDLHTIRKLDSPHVQAHYERLVVAQNAVLSVTGDFDPQELMPRLESFLLELPGWSFRPVNHPFERPFQTGRINDNLPREQSVVFEAFPDVGIRSDNVLLADCLDAYLSDMSGPLFTNIREQQQLAYFVSSARVLGPQFGMFYLYAGIEPGKEDVVFAAFDREIERLRNGDIKTAAFDHVRTGMKARRKSGLQSPGARGFTACLNALYGKPVEDWKDYDERIDDLKIDDLVKHARILFNPDNRLRLRVGPQ